jgi:hypothetical protein
VEQRNCFPRAKRRRDDKITRLLPPRVGV